MLGQYQDMMKYSKEPLLEWKYSWTAERLLYVVWLFNDAVNSTDYI